VVLVIRGKVRELTNFQLAFVRGSEDVDMKLHELLSHFHCLSPGLGLHDRVTANQFLCFGEGPVDDRHPSPSHSHTRAR
jgi:hypothetical protein